MDGGIWGEGGYLVAIYLLMMKAVMVTMATVANPSFFFP